MQARTLASDTGNILGQAPTRPAPATSLAYDTGNILPPTPAGPSPLYAPTEGAAADPYAAAASGPAGSLGQSGAYLAFLRALGLDDAKDATGNQVRIDALNRRAGLAIENNASQGAQQRQGIADSAETRGLFRSGARLRAQAGQEEGQARQQSGIINETADQTAGLIADMAQRRAERQQELAEKSYGAADSIYGSQG